MSTKTLWTICFVLIAVVITICLATAVSRSKDESALIPETPDQITKSTFTFILTHMAGEKLKKPAEFICGDLPKWVLDFKNGDKITYAIESGNKYNLLCGLETRDNNGDQCEICITKKEGRNVLIEFKYGSRTVWFTGFMA